MTGRILSGLCSIAVLGCGLHAGDPKVASTVRNNVPPRRAGETCTPAGSVVDEHFKPVDMEREASLMAVAGRPIFICEAIREAMSGRVVDEKTGSPIAGATTTIESWNVGPPIGRLRPNRELLQVFDVSTDSEGMWRIAEASLWMPGVLAADGIPFVLSSLCVRADGYAPFVFDPWKEGARPPDPKNFEIALRPATGMVEKTDSSLSKCGLPLGPPL
jgi:hypothetical protein